MNLVYQNGHYYWVFDAGINNKNLSDGELCYLKNDKHRAIVKYHSSEFFNLSSISFDDDVVMQIGATTDTTQNLLWIHKTQVEGTLESYSIEPVDGMEFEADVSVIPTASDRAPNGLELTPLVEDNYIEIRDIKVVDYGFNPPIHTLVCKNGTFYLISDEIPGVGGAGWLDNPAQPVFPVFDFLNTRKLKTIVATNDTLISIQTAVLRLDNKRIIELIGGGKSNEKLNGEFYHYGSLLGLEKDSLDRLKLLANQASGMDFFVEQWLSKASESTISWNAKVTLRPSSDNDLGAVDKPGIRLQIYAPEGVVEITELARRY
jgi:hypothetical protein